MIVTPEVDRELAFPAPVERWLVRGLVDGGRSLAGYAQHGARRSAARAVVNLANGCIHDPAGRPFRRCAIGADG